MHTRLIGLTIVLLLVGCGKKTPGEAAAAPPPTVKAPAIPTVKAPAVSTVKVNLNTVTREQLLAIPEVTKRMAHEFEEYRPYASIRQFRREIGKYVDAAQVARYEQFVFVPIVVNDCDAETLAQIPGVDEAKAAALIAGRPYATADDFLAALAKQVDAGAVATARRYLAE